MPYDAAITPSKDAFTNFVMNTDFTFVTKRI